MSSFDQQDRFDPVDAAVYAGSPRVVDHRGRTHLCLPSAGTLTFTYAGATARCDVTALATRGRGGALAAIARHRRQQRRLAPRSLELSNAGARMLASAMRELDTARQHPLTGWQRATAFEDIVTRWSFDLEEPPDWCTAPVGRGEAVADPFHPVALRHQGNLGDVRQAASTQEGQRVVNVRYRAGSSISFATRPAMGRVSGGVWREEPGWTSVPQRFELELPSAQLLLATYEAIEYVERTALRAHDVDEHSGLREALDALIRDVLAERIHAFDGYRRLIGLFEPSWAPSASEAIPPQQLNAVALIAIRCWTARGGGLNRDRAVNLERVTEVSGCRPASIGDELALRFDGAELVVRIHDDLAVGRATVIDAGGQVVSRPCALTADRLEWIAWAAAALATPQARGIKVLHAFLCALILDPWSDLQAGISLMIGELERLAVRPARRHRATASVLSMLLKHRPDSKAV